ncbi:MAG: hypothetical protein U9N44_08195 [Chloroflexota bacterium]|nr:hypothetical protein [Chloroflexota bacterium]
MKCLEVMEQDRPVVEEEGPDGVSAGAAWVVVVGRAQAKAAVAV